MPARCGLYRTDDSGGLNFTLLASASANIGTPPRRLRLESEGNTHRVFFNGAQVITTSPPGPTRPVSPASPLPSSAARQVKILSFEGGSLVQPR